MMQRWGAALLSQTEKLKKIWFIKQNLTLLQQHFQLSEEEDEEEEEELSGM